MRREKLLTIAIIALLLINIGTLVFVFIGPKHGPGPGMGGRPGAGIDRLIVEGLKLDAGQIEKFEVLKKEHRTAANEIFEKDRELHEVYFSLLKSAETDAKKASQILEEMKMLTGKKDSITFDHFKKLRTICKPEQQKLFDDLISEILRTMHRNQGRPGNEGPPPHDPGMPGH